MTGARMATRPRSEWTNVIESLNSSFNSNLLTTDLISHQLVTAKNKDDVNAKDATSTSSSPTSMLTTTTTT